LGRFQSSASAASLDSASVQVMLFADRLEIWNPGELPPSLTLAQLRVPHPSIPRNPLISEPLFLAHSVERAGRHAGHDRRVLGSGPVHARYPS
jgi:predicted HTH transcriptional regulator